MSEVIYSDRRSGFESGKTYRNPRHFRAPLADGIERVVVEGDWPAVVAAYQALGIEVIAAGTEADPYKMNVPELKVWLAAQGIEIEAGAKKADLQALIPKEESDNGADT